MQLFVYITNKPEYMPKILSGLIDEGISEGTVLDCTGMLPSLKGSEEEPSMFGSLREYLNPDYESGKMLLILMKDEDVSGAKSVLHRVVGDLKMPNTGILFTIPVMNWEGVSHK